MADSAGGKTSGAVHESSDAIVVHSEDAAQRGGSSAVQVYQDPRELTLDERLQQAEEHDAKLRHIIDSVPIKIKNQSGSSAGAGSGEFHIYRKGRDMERKRVEAMEKEWRENQAKLLAKRERDEAEAALEAKTSKRRAKRQKRKEKKLLKKGELASAQDTSDQAEGSSDAAEAAAGLNRGAAAAAAAAGDADALD